MFGSIVEREAERATGKLQHWEGRQQSSELISDMTTIKNNLAVPAAQSQPCPCDEGTAGAAIRMIYYIGFVAPMASLNILV